MNLLQKFKGTASDILVVLITQYYFVFLKKISAWGIVGSFLVIIGVGFWLKARWDLGEAFSVLPKATAIIKQGIYSKIRHPIYLSSAIATLGLCLTIQKLWIYIIFFLLVILQFFRAKKEEALFLKKFGAEYRNYKTLTWF